MTFYNVCPAEIESGGPELAHQMCHRLNDAGLEAYMYYKNLMILILRM